MPTERQLANLRPPIRPGEVLNPKGRNQSGRVTWPSRSCNGLPQKVTQAQHGDGP